MSSQPEHPVQTAGFWLFGFLSLVLTILKLTVAVHWSWSRVLLPLLAIVGHNALYILAGLTRFRWLKDEGGVDNSGKVFPGGYTIAALLFFLLFADNLLGLIEGQGWKGFWPCSGSYEVVVLYGTLSLLAQFAYWSRIVSGLNQDDT